MFFLKNKIIAERKIAKKYFTENKNIIENRNVLLAELPIMDMTQFTKELIKESNHQTIVMAVAKANDCYSSYKKSIATWGGFFKSFILGSKENHARINCAKAIDNSMNILLKKNSR